MRFYINGHEADITLDTEKNLGEVLKSFELECEKNNATTINVVVNGQVINPSDFDRFIDKPVDEIDTLELTTITEDDIVMSLQDIATNFSTIMEDLKLISVQFQNGQDKNALMTVTKLADNVDYFCKVTALTTLFPNRFEKMTIDGVNVQDFFTDFSSILTDFEDAFRNTDSVMLGDLAEYEITPRIESIITMINDIE